MVEGNQLRVDAPAGVMTDDLKAFLIGNKGAIIELLEVERVRLEAAGRHGLDIRWSEYPVWIKLHDPASGEWHEIRASECLPGVVESANRKRGRREATRTAAGSRRPARSRAPKTTLMDRS